MRRLLPDALPVSHCFPRGPTRGAVYQLVLPGCCPTPQDSNAPLWPLLPLLPLTPSPPRQLPLAWAQLDHMQTLAAPHNQIREMPAGLGQLQMLVGLDLSANQIEQVRAAAACVALA